MKKTYTYLSLTFLSLFFFMLFICSSCNERDKKNISPKPLSKEEKAIDINSVKVSLPYSDGVELVQANCITCHSLRYIEMQPDMTEKNWDKIVKKMIKNYGAPIADTTIANKIIDYLASVKGKK